MKIVRRPVREEIRSALLDRLLNGQLPPGSRVSESGLTAELGVSRTPLREALINLVQEGFLEAEMGRGFVVAGLTVDEVREIYPILWTLEGLALRESDPTPLIPELETLLEKMASAKDPDEILDLDTQWHEMVLSACPNKKLLEMIQRLKKVVHRYEYAFMRETNLVTMSLDHHQQILNALKERQVIKASTLLEDHWRFGMRSVVDWIEQQETKSNELTGA